MTNASNLINSCIQGNPGAVRFFIPLLLQTIIPLLSSPLAAPRVSRLFIKLRESAFYEVDRIHRFFGIISVLLTKNCKTCSIHSVSDKKLSLPKFQFVTVNMCICSRNDSECYSEALQSAMRHGSRMDKRSD